MKALAPLESWTLPGRCKKSRTCPAQRAPGYGAEQGIVAPCPFLLLVVAHGGSFGMTLGGLHRAVEVQSHSGWRQAHQANQDPILQEAPEVLDALGGGLLQGPAEGGHVRQSVEAEHAFDQGVVFIVAAVLEFAIAQQQVDNQLDKEGGPMEDLSHLEIAEALAQLSLEKEVHFVYNKVTP